MSLPLVIRKFEPLAPEVFGVQLQGLGSLTSPQLQACSPEPPTSPNSTGTRTMIRGQFPRPINNANFHYEQNLNIFMI